jgi:biopolymer transport protein TolQ
LSFERTVRRCDKAKTLIENLENGVKIDSAPDTSVIQQGAQSSVESLIATAMGLIAAIPAVIAFNYYLSTARRIIIEMEDFSEELLDFFTQDSA